MVEDKTGKRPDVAKCHSCSWREIWGKAETKVTPTPMGFLWPLTFYLTNSSELFVIVHYIMVFDLNDKKKFFLSWWVKWIAYFIKLGLQLEVHHQDNFSFLYNTKLCKCMGTNRNSLYVFRRDLKIISLRRDTKCRQRSVLQYYRQLLVETQICIFLRGQLWITVFCGSLAVWNICQSTFVLREKLPR